MMSLKKAASPQKLIVSLPATNVTMGLREEFLAVCDKIIRAVGISVLEEWCKLILSSDSTEDYVFCEGQQSLVEDQDTVQITNGYSPDLFENSELNQSKSPHLDLDSIRRASSAQGRDKLLPHQCHICSKICRSKLAFNFHLKSHSNDDRLLVCFVCDKKFKELSHLRRHQVVHTGDRSYVCQECGRSYIDSKGLEYHIRTYTGERPYSCTDCKMTFVGKSVLNKHMTRKHPISQGKSENKYSSGDDQIGNETDDNNKVQCEYRKDELITSQPKEIVKKQPLVYEDDEPYLHVDVIEIIPDDEADSIWLRSDSEDDIVLDFDQGVVTGSVTVVEYDEYSNIISQDSPGDNYNQSVEGDDLMDHQDITSVLHNQGHTVVDQDVDLNVSLDGEFVNQHDNDLLQVQNEETFVLEDGEVIITPEDILVQTHERPYSVNISELKDEEMPSLWEQVLRAREVTIHKCHICSRICGTASGLTLHIKYHATEKPNLCLVCGKVFKEAAHLRRHQTVHTGERRYVCTICGMAYTDPKGLKYHYRKHAGDKPFKCLHCNKRFPINSSLVAHTLRTHNLDECPYMCSKCGKKCALRQALKIHEVGCKGERPYPCQQCDKKFTTSGNLTKHQRVHSGQKPYACSVCDKMFSQASSAKEHIRQVHNRERPFKCTKCDKSFPVRGELKRHSLVHSRERKHACCHCRKTFSSLVSWKSHEAKHSTN